MELGCGPGTWTEIVEKKVKELVAVDISSEMVNLARRNAKNTKFHVIGALKFKTNKKFDKIFSIRAIEYIYNKRKFLKKMHSMLKPGGKLVIITKSKPNLWDITSKSEWQKRINARKLKKLMEDEGFKNVNYAPVSIRFPIFKRGVYEAPIIPEHKEKKALRIFNKLTNICRKLKILPSFFSIFSESYIIYAYK